MKTGIHFLIATLLLGLFAGASNAQQPAQPATAATPPPPANGAERVSFSLHNSLGYHCMFRAYGPGIAYGFTMNRNETVAKNWPAGTKLYFSKDGETNDQYILTITTSDAGKTVKTETPVPASLANLPMVSFKLRNNSLMPRKVAFITYEPGQTGNGTNIFMMGPYGTSKRRLPVGTKVYLADNAQVDVVMSGKRLDGGKPFLTVTKEIDGKTVNIAE
jgi:hypothetical protein